MTLRQYLILMSMATGMCWVAWLAIILSIDPQTASFTIFAFFYLSLFVALIGTISVIGFIIKRLMIKNDEIVFRHVKRTFRQSIIIASLLVLALVLKQKNLLTWWNGIMLIILFIFLEGMVFTNRRYTNQDYVK